MSAAERRPASGPLRAVRRYLLLPIGLTVHLVASVLRNPREVWKALAVLASLLLSIPIFLVAFVTQPPIRHGTLLRLCMWTSRHRLAEHYANELLAWAERSPDTWHTGNAIHRAHAALGRIALERGDVELAKRELLRSGATPGSPQLDTFGPNLRLAKELLAEGERETVLEYLRLCGRFWNDRGALEAWTESIERGETPDFGPNLRY